jgi:hypothetical protein
MKRPKIFEMKKIKSAKILAQAGKSVKRFVSRFAN